MTAIAQDSVLIHSPENAARARQALQADGALLIPNACTPEYARDVRTWMDARGNASNLERHYANTEVRIWDEDDHHAILEPFRQHSDAILSDVTGTPHRAYKILAIRNNQIPAGQANLETGRWHIDSFMRQLKVFLFLTTTTLDSGSFEYVPRTQGAGFKAGMALRGAYFKPLDFVRRTRAYAALPDSLVGALADKGYRGQPVLVEACTAMVVDTSTIHRARPCLAGSRYALTAYYR